MSYDDLERDLSWLRFERQRVTHELRRLHADLSHHFSLFPFHESLSPMASAALSELETLASDIEAYGATAANAINAALAAGAGGAPTGVAESDVQAAADKVTASFADLKAAIAKATAIGVTTPPAAITVSPATLPPATVGTAYTAALTPSGGLSPYQFAVTTGSFPTGLLLNTDGSVTGVPSAAGDFTAGVEVSDSSTPPLVTNLTYEIVAS
jgi:hypothetical protein